MSGPTNRISRDVTIREVWAHNLHGEFARIREIVDDYPHVAVDVEFPGLVMHHVGATFNSPADNHYQSLQTNVELLNVIRITITFFDDAGDLPSSPSGGGCRCVWQFNFREFDVDADIADPDAVEILRGRGVDFVKLREQGIDGRDFGELLMSSGAVLDDSVEWITSDGGYDIGFLLRILTGRMLPETLEEFFELVNIFFPTLYDVKHLTTFCDDDLDGGLVQVAELLGVENVGLCRQAGCDSLLTTRVFRKMKERYFDGAIEQYSGSLHGLNLNK
ncbi:probable CCR4-associated factor 1 homolog 7 [Elaeis guineensis]|uniref:poly(A)-specific ribonuclease n=1 Tax=Elaeis guineensis var. tenera TaxID=51953 RepID=A0A6I9RTP3_ELAGV|nr:probable CCR4-associated factor 1 homolog 7 [Elaeis guineensis]